MKRRTTKKLHKAKKPEDPKTIQRRESRARVNDAFLDFGAMLFGAMLDVYAPGFRERVYPFNYEAGAQFHVPQDVQPPSKQIDPPGLVNLVKDPVTGEWK